MLINYHSLAFIVQLCFTSLSIPKQGRRRGFVVRAASSSPESSESDATAKIAPLQLESPIGLFLSQILVNHPHLVPAAVDQQLEQLQTDRDADQQKEEPSASGTDLVLYRFVLFSCLLTLSYVSPSKYDKLTFLLILASITYMNETYSIRWLQNILMSSMV